MKSIPPTFNSHVSFGSNPCVNKAIDVQLVHRFGVLSPLVLGQSILSQLINIIIVIYILVPGPSHMLEPYNIWL